MSIPCVDPIIYPPSRPDDDVYYPVDAPDGRQWRPPAAPYIDVPSYKPTFVRACLECLGQYTNTDLVTGWLCRDCAYKLLRHHSDPFAVAHFWHSFTYPRVNMQPIDEYQWYRWYGWLATNAGQAVAPIQVFHDLTAACNAIMALGLIATTSTDHVKHYIGRGFRLDEQECREALAAGLMPPMNTTISEVDGIHD